MFTIQDFNLRYRIFEVLMTNCFAESPGIFKTEALGEQGECVVLVVKIYFEV